MVRHYDYIIPKTEVLAQCKSVLESLDYQIDIFSLNSYVLTTKKIKFRRILRRYDYLIYIQVTDRVEIYIVADRNIFNRGSESAIGGSNIITQQPEDKLPLELQSRIFNSIETKLRDKQITRIQLNR